MPDNFNPVSSQGAIHQNQDGTYTLCEGDVCRQLSADEVKLYQQQQGAFSTSSVLSYLDRTPDTIQKSLETDLPEGLIAKSWIHRKEGELKYDVNHACINGENTVVYCHVDPSDEKVNYAVLYNLDTVEASFNEQKGDISKEKEIVSVEGKEVELIKCTKTSKGKPVASMYILPLRDNDYTQDQIIAVGQANEKILRENYLRDQAANKAKGESAKESADSKNKEETLPEPGTRVGIRGALDAIRSGKLVAVIFTSEGGDCPACNALRKGQVVETLRKKGIPCLICPGNSIGSACNNFTTATGQRMGVPSLAIFNHGNLTVQPRAGGLEGYAASLNAEAIR